MRGTFLKLDQSRRSGLASAWRFQCLRCASKSTCKLGSKPRGMTSHTNSCCEFRVHSLDNSVRAYSRSKRNEHGTIQFAGKRTNLLTFSHFACAKGLIPLSVPIDRHFGVLDVTDFFHRQLFDCELWHFSGALWEDVRSIRIPLESASKTGSHAFGHGAARDTL